MGQCHQRQICTVLEQADYDVVDAMATLFSVPRSEVVRRLVDTALAVLRVTSDDAPEVAEVVGDVL